MRAVPIPEGLAEAWGGRRVVIGEPGDPTRDDVRPCEYVITPSALYPGRPCVSALVELDDEDRARAAAGARLWLTLDGGELPWSLSFDTAGSDSGPADAGIRLERLLERIDRATYEARNVLPDLSDDQAAAVEAFAIELLKIGQGT